MGAVMRMVNSKVLNSQELMDMILNALDEGEPLSVINVGATETFVMAQYTVLPEDEFMNHSEAEVANWGVKSGFHHRGVRFPNTKIRDDAVEAVRKADIVGYNRMVRKIMGYHWRVLTERVFDAYGIEPKYIFDGYLRRVIMFSQKDKFEQMLAGRRILLVGATADDARDALNRDLRDRIGFDIVGTVKIYEYEEIPEAKKQIDEHNFDLCLLSAGTNAMILASYISTVHGKVAFDIGNGMNSLYTGEVYSDPWLELFIGMDNLMKM
jgi:hypothetical protein